MKKKELEWTLGEEWYGDELEEDFEELWSDDLEIAGNIAMNYDYTWDIDFDSKAIHLEDSGYMLGIEDETLNEREEKGIAVLNFKNVKELFEYFLPKLKECQSEEFIKNIEERIKNL